MEYKSYWKSYNDLEAAKTITTNYASYGRRDGKRDVLDSMMYAFAESDRKLHHPILFECNSLRITNAIFNPPATIVFWEDGTKTVVKAIDEEFDPEKGLAMAFTKKALGNQGNYYNQLKKWIPSKNGDNSLLEASANAQDAKEEIVKLGVEALTPLYPLEKKL